MLDSIYDTRVKPYLKEITKWRAEGRTAKEVSNSLGVKNTTFYTYLKQYPELEDAWIEGETQMVNKLEVSAINAATGYKFEEKRIEEVFDIDNNLIGKKIITFEKMQHPNGPILTKCLESLNPAKWKTDQKNNEIEIKLTPELLEYSE